MSANSPDPDPDAPPPDAEPTELTAIFRRLAEHSAPLALDETPEIIGFAEPAEAAADAVLWTAPIEPFVPAGEDLAALAPTLPVALAISRPEPELEREPESVDPEVETKPARVSLPAPDVAIPPPRSGTVGERLSQAMPRPKPGEAPPPAPSAEAASPPSPAGRREQRWGARAASPGVVPAPAEVDAEHRGPNRRLHRRAKLPAQIEVEGMSCSLIDLSVGGFAVLGLPALAPHTVVPVALRLTIDGIEVGTRLTARMVYGNRMRSSGRFIDASASQIAFLRYLVTWRGESVGAAGVNTLLDAVSGGSERAAADPSSDPPAGEAPKDRWWLGLMGRKIASPR